VRGQDYRVHRVYRQLDGAPYSPELFVGAGQHLARPRPRAVRAAARREHLLLNLGESHCLDVNLSVGFALVRP
jgi:hypothetical protein